MKRMALVLFVSAGTLFAQAVGTSSQEPSQNSVVRQKLEALGYTKLSIPAQGQPANAGCAIPLLRVPIPQGQNFAAKTVPVPPNVDPKILVKPPLSACADKTLLVVTPIVPGK